MVDSAVIGYAAAGLSLGAVVTIASRAWYDRLTRRVMDTEENEIPLDQWRTDQPSGQDNRWIQTTISTRTSQRGAGSDSLPRDDTEPGASLHSITDDSDAPSSPSRQPGSHDMSPLQNPGDQPPSLEKSTIHSGTEESTAD